MVRFRASHFIALLSALAVADSFSADLTRPTLVVGSTGKVGRLVVSELVSQGRPVHALVRNATKAREDAKLPLDSELLKVFCGDLHSEAELRAACQGCGAVIAVSGTTRFSKPGDFLPWRFFGNDPMAARRATRPLEDLTHPYAVNYEGIVRLARVAEESGATKFVRLTGLSVGFPVYNPVTVLFNLLLSLTGKWHDRAEKYLRSRQHALDVTILRPGGLSDLDRGDLCKVESEDEGECLVEETVNVQLVASEDGAYKEKKQKPPPPPGRIGRRDVAALAVECALGNPKASRRTLSIRWVGSGDGIGPAPQGDASEGSPSWAMELEKLDAPPPPPSGPDVSAAVRKSRPYAAAVAAAPPLILLFAAGAAGLLKWTAAKMLG